MTLGPDTTANCRRVVPGRGRRGFRGGRRYGHDRQSRGGDCGCRCVSRVGDSGRAVASTINTIVGTFVAATARVLAVRAENVMAVPEIGRQVDEGVGKVGRDDIQRQWEETRGSDVPKAPDRALRPSGTHAGCAPTTRPGNETQAYQVGSCGVPAPACPNRPAAPRNREMRNQGAASNCSPKDIAGSKASVVSLTPVLSLLISVN